MFGIVRLWILAFLIQSLEIDLATHTAHNLKLPRIVQTSLLANVLARSLYLCSLVVAHWFGCLIYHSISIELLNYPFPHPRSFHHEPRPQKVHININWVQLFEPHVKRLMISVHTMLQSSVYWTYVKYDTSQPVVERETTATCPRVVRWPTPMGRCCWLFFFCMSVFHLLRNWWRNRINHGKLSRLFTLDESFDVKFEMNREFS